MVKPPGGSRPTRHAAAPSDATDAERAAGALLLCRAEPDEVAHVARLLRGPLVLCPAGEPGPGGEARWSALVPEDKPWLHGGEPVDRILTGWATALAVGASWPVLALWWDHERAGLVLCSGFRRPVGYEWAADGTPLGEDEAMRTFVLRLGLDPVLDLQELGPLTREDPESDAGARLRGVLAVLARAELRLPAGLLPGEPADRLRSVAAVVPGNRPLSWSGWRDAVRGEIDAVASGTLGRPPARWPGGAPGSRGPGARFLAGARCAVGLPLLAYGLRRRDHGWCCAGSLLVAQGLFALARDRTRAGAGDGVRRAARGGGGR